MKITPEIIIENLKKLRDIKPLYFPRFHAMTKKEWLEDTIFNFTEEEINNPDADGKIGSKYGADCYIHEMWAVSPVKKVPRPDFNKLFGKKK
jgi:hypothetical protein